MRKNLLLIMLFNIIISCNKNPEVEIIKNDFFNVKFTNNYHYKDSLYPSPFNKEYWLPDLSYFNEKIYSDYYISREKYSTSKRFNYFQNDCLEIEFSIDRKNESRLMVIFHCLIGSNDPHRGRYSKCYYILWKNKDEGRWEIYENTDTVYSNISKEEIKKIYPKFKGEYINPKISEIIVNHNYKIDNYRFYQDVEFIGFNRFLPGIQIY